MALAALEAMMVPMKILIWVMPPVDHSRDGEKPEAPHFGVDLGHAKARHEAGAVNSGINQRQLHHPSGQRRNRDPDRRVGRL